MIHAIIILAGLTLAITVGFFGLVRMRFAIGLVLACMMLNLFGCSTAHAETGILVGNSAPSVTALTAADVMQLWSHSGDCRNGGFDVKTQICSSRPVVELWTGGCAPNSFLRSDGTCARPLENGDTSNGLEFSTHEMLLSSLGAWMLGVMLGVGIGILLARRVQ